MTSTSNYGLGACGTIHVIYLYFSFYFVVITVVYGKPDTRAGTIMFRSVSLIVNYTAIQDFAI
jgi:hypothetical protein